MRTLMAILLTSLALPPALLAASPQTITLDVQGMSCAVCPITVKVALKAVPGVSQVSVDFAEKTAMVTFDPDQATATDLTSASGEAGFPATVQQGTPQ
jgi:periplasmic mercuric ion binding protein